MSQIEAGFELTRRDMIIMGIKERHQLNVRVDEDTKRLVDKVAERYRISRSEVLRLVLWDRLSRYEERQARSLSEDERVKLLELMATTEAHMGALQKSLNGLGNNINQIARAVNTGAIDGDTAQEESPVKYYAEISKQHIDHFNLINERLDIIWQLLR